MRGLRRGHDALAAREPHGLGEALVLRVGAGLDESELHEVRDQRSHPVVAQAAGMDPGGMNAWPSVCIGSSGVSSAVSPKS